MLDEICSKLGWHPTNGSCKGVWDRGKNARPLGHQALWSCVWRIGGKPGEPYAVHPGDICPIESMSAAQALAELRDIVFRDSQRKPADHPGGDKLHQEGKELLSKIESMAGDGWLRPVRKYLGVRRKHYPDFGAPWNPPRGIPFMRPGWGAKGFTE